MKKCWPIVIESSKQFVNTVEVLGEKLGPMVFQFPFFNEEVIYQPRAVRIATEGFLREVASVCDTVRSRDSGTSIG